VAGPERVSGDRSATWRESACGLGGSEADPELGYPLAGSFVAYLLDVHGIDAVRSFFEACGAAPRRHEAAFQRAFGRTVASASLGWRASLARGESATWRWTEPASWPGTLQRDPARAVATREIARSVEPGPPGRAATRAGRCRERRRARARGRGAALKQKRRWNYSPEKCKGRFDGQRADHSLGRSRGLVNDPD
jgi:hypothetical protein